MPDSPAILVAGAFGAFGQTLVRDLLRHSRCRVLAAGRGRSDIAPLLRGLERDCRERLAPALCDLNDLRSVASAITNVQTAVCAAGPYQELPLLLLDACQQRGIPYLDLADDRGFVRRGRALVVADGPAAGIGWSAAPALSALLARLAGEGLETIDEILVQIAPGSRSPRGTATIFSLCDSLAKPFTIPDRGGWRKVLGWSEPRVFDFPLPVGPREGFLVDVADHELFPTLFGAGRVEFRAGAEFRWMNRGACAMAWLSRELAFDWTELAPLLSAGLKAASFLGKGSGALGVEVLGRNNGAACRRRACITAESDGQSIPILAAAILAPKLADKSSSYRGLIPLDRWLTRGELEAECVKRGLSLSLQEVPA